MIVAEGGCPDKVADILPESLLACREAKFGLGTLAAYSLEQAMAPQDAVAASPERRFAVQRLMSPNRGIYTRMRGESAGTDS